PAAARERLGDERAAGEILEARERVEVRARAEPPLLEPRHLGAAEDRAQPRLEAPRALSREDDADAARRVGEGVVEGDALDRRAVGALLPEVEELDRRRLALVDRGVHGELLGVVVARGGARHGAEARPQVEVLVLERVAELVREDLGALLERGAA